MYQTQAVLTAKKLLPVRQNIAANSIQYLWNSYKISQEELGARGSLIKQLNKSKHHIEEQLPAHKIFVSAFEKIKKAQQGEAFTINSIEEAKEIIKQGGIIVEVAKAVPLKYSSIVNDILHQNNVTANNIIVKRGWC